MDFEYSNVALLGLRLYVVHMSLLVSATLEMLSNNPCIGFY